MSSRARMAGVAERRGRAGRGDGEGASGWVETAARAGYTAKAAVYAVIGVLAFQQAIGSGGGTTGSSGALREIASGPFGTILISLLALGLAGYVIWRLVQAFLDPEADYADEGKKRLAKRAFYFASAVLYGLLAYQALDLVLGGGGGASGGGSGGGGGGGGSTQTWTARLMSQPAGVWLVGAVGAGMIGRGILQLVKAYTESFRKRIRSFDLGPARSRWVVTASRVGLTARGVIFGLIGGSLIAAAIQHDPREAGGLEETLGWLAGTPWLLGAIGAGLVCYAVYQLVKARYRLIGA